MNILEKEIEDLIWHGITNELGILNQKGLNINKEYRYLRQVDLGSYGRPDIVGFNFDLKYDGCRKVNIHLIEIKKEEVNENTFTQALRYCTGINRLISSSLKGCSVSFKIDLIGKYIAGYSDFIYLPNLFRSVGLYTYHIGFNEGLFFKEHKGYHLKDESFPLIEQYKQFAKDIIKICFKDRDLPF